MSIAAADVLALGLIKQHLRILHDAEDELIRFYADAALEWCLWYCDDPRITSVEDLSAKFKQAMLLVIGDAFTHRESFTELRTYENETAQRLLWADRNWRNKPTQEGSNDDSGN